MFLIPLVDVFSPPPHLYVFGREERKKERKYEKNK